MENFSLLFLCFSAGILLRRMRIFDGSAAQVLNRFVIYISLPALTLKELHKLDISALNIWVPLMPWIWFFVAWALLVFLNRWLKLSKLTLGALVLTSGLGNTSFVGLPLLEILFGPQAISTGIVLDLGGSFLVASVFGIFAAQFYAEKRFSIKNSFFRIISFPPFLAVIAAFALRSYSMPSSIDSMLNRLALTLVPLALFAVGLQLDVSQRIFKKRKSALLVGLGLKLIISPILFVTVYGCSGVLHGEVLRIVLAESAMAPMITGGVIASEQGLDADTSNLMLGLGIPISFVSVPIWKMLFDFLV